MLSTYLSSRDWVQDTSFIVKKGGKVNREEQKEENKRF